MFDQLFFLMLSGVFLYSAKVSRQRLQYAQMMYLGHNPSKWEVLFNTLMMSSACAAIASSVKFISLTSLSHTLSGWFFVYTMVTMAFAYSVYLSTKLLCECLRELRNKKTGYEVRVVKALYFIVVFALMGGFFAFYTWQEFYAALK